MPSQAKTEKIKAHISQQTELFFWHSPGEGVPLLMLHGHGGDHRGLLALARQLACPVFVVDLPGFGSSKELASHSMQAYVEALMAFADAQKLHEYNLFGHSLGSAVALALAEKDARVRRLVLVNPAPEFTKFIRKLVKFMGDAATRLPAKTSEALIHAGLYNLATFLLHSTKRHNFKHARDYLSTQKTARYSLRAWREAGEAIYEMDQFKAAGNVAAPTLLLHGDKDRMTTLIAVERFKGKFKNAHLKRVPEAGHFIPLENSLVAAEYINNFLSEAS